MGVKFFRSRGVVGTEDFHEISSEIGHFYPLFLRAKIIDLELGHFRTPPGVKILSELRGYES